MKTSQEAAAFKVTVLLSAIATLLIVNFYFIYAAFETMQSEVPLLTTIYVLSTVSILLALYSIYFVRLYMHKQRETHSMHDHETALFNKKFFLAELHTTFQRADRHENPLSMISVSFDENTLQSVDKKAFMEELGEICNTVSRESDIACRYDVNHMVILLPLTEGEEAQILESRLRDALENHNFQITPKIMFSIKSTQAEWDESEEAFLERAL